MGSSPGSVDSPSQKLKLAYQDYLCSSLANDTSNAIYKENLNATLSSLQVKSLLRLGFYNASAGKGHNRVNGLFLCRGHISPTQCQRCVKASKEAIKKLCAKKKEAVIWLDHCMLRYLNQSIFSAMEDAPKVIRPCGKETIRPSLVQPALRRLLEDLAAQALSSEKLFATGRIDNLSFLGTVYGQVQCTKDITTSECRDCLSISAKDMTVCCYGRQGGTIHRPSCSIRYGRVPFNETDPAQLASPSGFGIGENLPIGKEEISKEIWVIFFTFVVVVLISALLGCLFGVFRARKKSYATEKEKAANEFTKASSSLKFDLDMNKVATSHFSSDNLIGEGGFGRVYKGKLKNGQVIAVKRLASSSKQGAEEFRNEVTLLAKLQDRNLMRMLGFCLEREEKILIYEFVPKKSLDYFLFGDRTRRGQLEWPTCYNIINGIARRLLYLHQGSEFRVVHRDLKRSNVLLDVDMNPKFSDFGMAKIFGRDQSQGNTSRVVGKFYMYPEYAMHGEFSVKFDVFSFGVIVLEIISGERIYTFDYQGDDEDLLSYAWRQWRAGTPLKLMDRNLTDTPLENEVSRCSHVGLPCIQEDQADRPEMAAVSFMLQNLRLNIPLPKQPPL